MHTETVNLSGTARQMSYQYDADGNRTQVSYPDTNYIKYTYNRDNNVLYPYKITYTGHGSSDGISTVSFATSTRPDTRFSYASGFAATTTVGVY